MLEKIVKYAPPTMKASKTCRHIYDILNNCNPIQATYLSYNYHKLKKFKDIHKGQRGFVIGNGPSINEMDLLKLKEEVTIGCNRIYLNERITPGYYCLEDALLLSKVAREVEGWGAESTIKFFPISLKKYRGKIKNLYFVNLEYRVYQDGKPDFSENFGKIAYGGATVAYMMLQLAYFLGCNPIYLIGMDGVRPDEPKHFYPKDGVVENVADYKSSDAAFIKAREFLESKGVKIYDATLNPLKPFYKRVKYEAIFR